MTFLRTLYLLLYRRARTRRDGRPRSRRRAHDHAIKVLSLTGLVLLGLHLGVFTVGSGLSLGEGVIMLLEMIVISRITLLFEFDSPMYMRRQILQRGDAARARRTLCIGITLVVAETVGIFLYRLLFLPMPD